MLSPAMLKMLKEELESPALDELDAVVTARAELSRGAVSAAVERLRDERDKLYLAAPLIYKMLKNLDEEREAAAALWQRAPRQPSPGARAWL